MNKFLSVMVLGLLSPNLWAVEINPAPEPQTLFLLGIGAVALLIAHKKRK